MQIRIVSSLKELGPALWRPLEPAHFPFFDYEFLVALEDSGSIGAAVGWQPLYLVAEDEKGPCAVLCTYAKGHSYGEYIFDWEWARFYQSQGVPYYPKLLTSVPFTPATGPRILLHPGAPAAASAALIQAALKLAAEARMSSYHALFIPAAEAPLYAEAGCLLRHSFQYHWRNDGYRDFADFLDALIGKRRRDIVRERRRAQAHGLELRCLSGTELTAEHAAAMERLYLTTTDKKDATPYLAPGFFHRVFAAMPDRLVFVTASLAGRIVAGALNFRKGDTLYGRYWGSEQSYQDLHFELCYYQTIDYAIAHGLRLFEAGAQGEHKIQRGFMPSLTLSAHRLFAPPLHRAVAAYVASEQAAVANAIRELAKQGPFRPQPAPDVGRVKNEESL